MNDLYLILHKVRGSPAFDIAEQIEIEGEDVAWIIPTSGHRAYPLRYWLLEDLYDGSDMDMPKPESVINDFDATNGNMNWIACPDHYQANASPKEERASADSLLASLGLPTKVHSAVSGKLTRRI
jgi:hypothetical protein